MNRHTPITDEASHVISGWQKDTLGPDALKPRQTYADIRWRIYLRMLNDTKRHLIPGALGLPAEWIAGRDETTNALDDFEEQAWFILEEGGPVSEHRKAEVEAALMAIDGIRDEVAARWEAYEERGNRRSC